MSDWSDIPCDAPARESERRARDAADTVAEWLAELSWSRRLGRNLATAGALTRSYLVGFARGFYYDCDDGETWRPNINGKAAPCLPPGTDDTKGTP